MKTTTKESLAVRRFTSQEMRVRADYLEAALADAKTAGMLRQAVDDMEREKKYEYAAMFVRKLTGKRIGESASHYGSLAEAKDNHHWPLVGEDIVFVRRAVGEWEEVKE